MLNGGDEKCGLRKSDLKKATNSLRLCAVLEKDQLAFLPQVIDQSIEISVPDDDRMALEVVLRS